MKVKYTGFFTRFIAFLLDGLFLYIPLDILEKISNEYFYIPLFFIVWWLYNSLMLSSSWGATFGKKILSIKILDENMQQLNFKKASIRYLYSIISYMFLLPIFMIFFTNKKQTFHDYFAKTIAIDDINKFDYQELKIQNNNSSKEKLTYFRNPFQIEFTTKKKSNLRTIIIVVVLVAITIPIGYMVIYMSVMYKLYSGNAKSYDNSFKIKYSIKDYNNSKIIFYNQELETNTQKHIEAKGMYEIFEADVKNDLALNCVEYFLAREHNVSDWIEMGSGFRKNARNKYANTEAMIEKAKKNEDHMGKYFYYYDLNDVNHIVDDIADIWKKDANTDTCQKMLPVDQMYTMFVMQYIKNREEALKNDKRSYQYAKPSGMLNKSFYKKKIEETSAWLEMLYEKHPKLLIEKKKQKAKFEKEYQEILKKENTKKIAAQKRRAERYKKELVAGKDPLLLALQYEIDEDFEKLLVSGVDLEKKEQNDFTPLFYASSSNNTYAVKKLLDAGANMYAMSKHNAYSAFTWSVSNQNIDTVQLFLDYGVDVNHQNNKSETALTIAAKGCKNFELVQLLLENGANPELIDTYRQNTISGLFRYCKKNENYTKMIDLLKRYK